MTGHGGNQKVKKTMKNTVHFLSLTASKIYCVLLHLYLSYNQFSQRYSPCPPLTHWYKSLFRDPTCPAHFLLDWQHINALSWPASQLVITVFELQTNLEWSGLNPWQRSRPVPKVKSHCRMCGTQAKQLPWRVSWKTFPDDVPTPRQLPEHLGLLSFTTLF